MVYNLTPSSVPVVSFMMQQAHYS